MKTIDITGKVCDLHPNTGDWPMYSFDRIAYTTLQAAADEMQKAKFTQNQIQAFFQSKSVRWALDGGEFLDAIEQAGKALAQVAIKERGKS